MTGKLAVRAGLPSAQSAELEARRRAYDLPWMQLLRALEITD